MEQNNTIQFPEEVATQQPQQQQEFTFPEIKTDNTSPTSFIADDVRSKFLGDTSSLFQAEADKRNFLATSFDTPKIKLENYDVTVGEAYRNIGGTYYSKYPVFFAGMDNEELYAQNQSTSQKWGRGLTKLLGKTGTAVLGGTIGQISGLGNWISDGFKMESLYMDDFNKWLDDLNEKMDYKLPNYYTRQEQDMNFGQSLGTANFIANDLTQGLSFTFGMMVSEGIWAFATGGASLATAAARNLPGWGLRSLRAAEISKGISTWNKTTKQLLKEGLTKPEIRQVLRARNVGTAFNTARFTYTSAGYEAGVEARHMYKEAEENFLYEFEKENGRKPNGQEIAEWSEIATKAANAVYAGNVAVVGSSNLLIFGRMFNTRLPSVSPQKYFDKKLFGIGTEVVDGQRVAIKATKAQKLASRTYSPLKLIATEAFWEEGNQSVMGNAAQAWIEAAYNAESSNEVMSMMEAVYEGFSETYSSKEGWKEIGLGAIIGLFGGGVSGSFTANSRKRKVIEQYSEYLNKEGNSYASQRFADKLAMLNRINKAGQLQDEADNRGDLTGSHLSRRQAIMSQVDFHNKYGMLEEGRMDFEAALAAADNQKMAEEAGISIEEVSEFKKKLLDEYTQIQDSYTKNKEFADAVLGQGQLPTQLQQNEINKEMVATGIAYNLTMGEGSAQMAGELLEQMRASLAGMQLPVSITQALELDNILGAAEATTKAEFHQARQEAEAALEKKQQIEREIKRETQNMNAAEEKAAYQNKLLELSTQLEQANQAELEAKNRMDVAVNAMKISNPYLKEGDTVAAEDILELYKNTKKKGSRGVLEDVFRAIEKLKATNPKDYQRHTKLYNEYKKAQYAYMQYAKTTQGLTSDNFNLPQFATKLGYKMFKGKDVNQFTKDFFADIGTQIIATEAMRQRELIEDAVLADEILEPSTQADTPTAKNTLTEEQLQQLQTLEREKAAALKSLKDNTKNNKKSKELQDRIAEIDGKITSLKPIQIVEEGNAQTGDYFSRVVDGETLVYRKTEQEAILLGTDEANSILRQETSREAQQLEKEKAELQEQLTNLQNQAPQETAEDIEARFEAQRKNILSQQQKQDAIGQTQRQIDEMLKQNSPIAEYIGEDRAQAQANKPTQQEVEEYKTLIAKQKETMIGKTNLIDALENNTPQEVKDFYGDALEMSVQELQRFQELNDKMANWYLMEGTIIGETSLADLVERLELLQTNPTTSNTKTEMTRKDAYDIEQASEKQAASTRQSKSMVQTPTGVYMKVDKTTKRRRLSHITVQSILDRLLPNTGATYIKNKKDKKPKTTQGVDLNKIQKQEGVIFFIETPQGTIKVEVGEHSRLFITEADWAKIENDFAIKFFTSEIDPQAKSGILGYEVQQDGTVIPAKSDFTIDTVLKNRPQEMVAEEMGQVKSVDLYVDPLNTYNAQLIANLERAKKSKNEKAIKEAERKLEEETVVYLMSQGKIVGTLRAGLSGIDTTQPSHANFSLVRALASQTVQQVQGENLINLKTTIPVGFIYQGSPIFKMRVDENGSLQLDFLPITEKVVSLLLDAGYVQNGQLVIGGKVKADNVQTTYLPKNSQKTPIVIFKYKGENVAFPVSLIPSESNLINEVSAILSSTTIPLGQQINQVHKLLLANGIDPNQFNLNEQTIQNRQTLDLLEEVLSTHTTIPNVDLWAQRNFNLNNLKTQAEISIDIENNPFNNPKVVLDLSQTQIPFTKEEGDQIVLDNIEERQIQLESELSDGLIEVEKIENEKNRGQDETPIMEFFGDNTVLIERDIINHAQKLQNKNTLVKFLESFPQKNIPKHLKEKVKALRDKVGVYEALLEKRGAIKNKNLKNQTQTVKNKKCKQ